MLLLIIYTTSIAKKRLVAKSLFIYLCRNRVSTLLLHTPELGREPSLFEYDFDRTKQK